MNRAPSIAALAIAVLLLASSLTQSSGASGLKENGFGLTAGGRAARELAPPSMPLAIQFRASSRGANAQENPFQLGVARFFKNGVKFYEKTGGGSGGRGFNIAAIDPHTGDLLQPVRNFDTWGTRSTGTEMNGMISFLNSLLDGTLILIAVCDEAGLTQDNSCTPLGFPWTENALQTLEALGSSQIRSYCYRASFAMVAVKGDPGSAREQVIDGAEAAAQTTLTTMPLCPTVSDVSPSSGPVGSLITITGTQLTGVFAVRFSNAVPANFSITNDTELTVIVPAGAVSGPITLRKTDCSDVQTTRFTVTVACPFMNNITPQSALPGSAITITGANFFGVSAIRFSNSGPASFSVTSDAQLSVIVPANAASGPITITKPGCPDLQTSAFTVLVPEPLHPGPSEVSISGRQLILRKRNADGSLGPAAPFVMKGVDWSPASRETNTSPFDPNNANVRRREFGIWAAIDIPLMKQMNVNTVRLFIDPGFDQAGRAVLDQLYINGIMAIITVDDAINDKARAQQVVNFYKDHPAVLMWMLGSEWNINRYFGVAASVQDAAQRTEDAARLIKPLDANHPVATSYGEIDIPADGLRLADTQTYVNTVCQHVDVWSLNIYRGNTFGNLFSQWQSITTKPMFIGEFGTDVFRSATTTNPPPGMVDEAMQAQWDASLWNHVFLNLSANNASKVAVGANVIEWNDEWWKVPPPGSQETGGCGPPDCNGHPDHFSNEEYYGIVTIDRIPRQAYGVLAAAFAADYQPAPVIISANFNGAKKVTIEGQGFGNAPRLFINGVDRSNFITSASDTLIQIKGKPKKLGLVTGDNTVQLTSAGGRQSNVVIIKI